MIAPRRDEDRMVRLLAEEGLLKRSHRAAIGHGVLTAVAGLGLFAGGWATAALRPEPAVAGSTYVMLLYPSERFRPDPAHVAEYGAWARKAHGEGRVVDGQELGRTVAVLGPPASGAPNGLFVIQARSEASAIRLARSTPHLRHGGGVILRASP